MTYLSKRFLIVFNSSDFNDPQIQKKIQHYQTLIKHSRELNSSKTEYFLLFVVPHIPAYAIQSQEIFLFAEKTVKNNKKFLKALGEQLEIKPENQVLAEGISDFQAWHLAKQLKVDKVFGYSKIFIKFLNTCKSIQYKWAQIGLRKKSYKEISRAKSL